MRWLAALLVQFLFWLTEGSSILYPNRGNVIVLLVLFTPLLPACYAQERVFDFLLLGDVRGWPNHLGDEEPAVVVTLGPCRAFGQDISDEFLFRWSRIYFPRSDDELLNYDVLFFNHPVLSFFTLLQQEMMVDFMGVEGEIPIAYPLSH